MELVDIEVVDVVHEMVIRAIEVMGVNPIFTESGSPLSELAGSSSPPISKPPTPDMSSIICPIKDLYTIEGKENIAPINPNSDKQRPKGSKFIALYKDRENSASKKEEIVKSYGKDLSKIGKIKYRVAKDSLYCREIIKKKWTPAQKELLIKATQPSPHQRCPSRRLKQIYAQQQKLK